MSTTLSRPGTKPKRRSARSTGWVPQQHGAWAMLITPFVLGAGLQVRDDGWAWHLLPLFGAWLFGYFTFSAASLWVKSRRKPRFLRPMVTYAGLTGGLGLLALLLSGPPLLGWAVVYLPLTAVALWLVAHHRERSTLSGMLTIAAAALMAVTAAHPHPLDALRPESSGAWWLAALAFAYFFGTVPYVKTLVRERGHRAWVVGSVAYHAAVTALTAVAAAVGALSWLWPAFFALTTLRALLVPALGPLSDRTVTPKQAGIGEIGVTVLFAALALVLL